MDGEKTHEYLIFESGVAAVYSVDHKLLCESHTVYMFSRELT